MALRVLIVEYKDIENDYPVSNTLCFFRGKVEGFEITGHMDWSLESKPIVEYETGDRFDISDFYEYAYLFNKKGGFIWT